MTKEQEVIKYIKTRIKICNENADICDDNDFDEEATYLREESYMLETVLSMLKEKDAKIEHLEEKRNNQKAELAILNEKQKEMNKLTNTVSSYKGMFKRQQKDQEKKDKIIDLMAEEINETDRGYTDYCEMKIECDRNCKDCIKRYFKRKATNNG